MISVIVPTHNRLELLERKLRVLENQGSGFEVVVVNDGCTDGTAEFLETYQAEFPLEVAQTQGRGVAFARNRGAQAAKGEILLFSDDDVLPQAGWLEAHGRAHAGGKTVGIGKLTLPGELKGSGAAEMLGPGVFWWNVTGNNTSLPKALFEEVGGYDERFVEYGGEDPDLGYRLYKVGAKIKFIPEASAVHEAWDHQGKALEKARKAGSAHVQVWQKHKDNRIAWGLGVHPTLVVLKMALLPSIKGFFKQGDYELAYAWGAWDALERGKNA